MLRDMVNPVRLYNALRYSSAGLAAAFRAERAFQQEVACAIILIPVALWLGKTGTDKALLIGSVMLVLIVELINTAVEVLVERISPDWHTLSGRAKDVGSASVFLAILNVLIVWGLVLLN